MSHQTIIVGGGMAGMACATHLLEAKKDFLIITDNLGGRIRYSESARVNFGAYFVMGNYAHARKLVERGRRVDPLKACFHKNSSERYAVISLHTLQLLPEFLRLLVVMLEFSRHYEAYKQRCLLMPVREALAADDYMRRVYSQPALQFVREKCYEHAAMDYVSMFAYGCTGADIESLTALDFLNVSMGLIVPIHNIIFHRGQMEKLLGTHLVTDGILKLENKDGDHVLTGASGQTYTAKTLVLATPAAVTQTLLGLPDIRTASQIYVHHLRGELKPAYQSHEINLFPYSSEIMLTARQEDGTFLVYSRVKGTDLHLVCKQYELIEEVDWEKAMYVHGTQLLDQQVGDSIWIAGDHNGLGLEPTALSGIYAANQVINHLQRSQSA